MISWRERLARLHLAWLWLSGCVAIVLLSELTGAGMLDGGFGSLLFGILFLVGAPILLLARLGVALMSWGPGWLQATVAVILVLGATALADWLLTGRLRDA